MTTVSFKSTTHKQLFENQDNMPNGAIVVCTDVSRMYVKLDDKLLPMTPPWNKNIQYHARKCVNCGATLVNTENRFIVKCEYCDTIYDIDNIEEESKLILSKSESVKFYDGSILTSIGEMSI